MVQYIYLPLAVFLQVCTAAFSVHSDLLYNDEKYANKTTIRTSLRSKVVCSRGILILFHHEIPDCSWLLGTRDFCNQSLFGAEGKLRQRHTYMSLTLARQMCDEFFVKDVCVCSVLPTICNLGWIFV